MRSSPSPTIGLSGPATGYGHERDFIRCKCIQRYECKQLFIVALFITDLMLSLCVKSCSLNFLPCTLKILYLFRQNVSASSPRPPNGAVPLDPAGRLPSPRPSGPLQESMVPFWPPNSGSQEPPPKEKMRGKGNKTNGGRELNTESGGMGWISPLAKIPAGAHDPYRCGCYLLSIK